MLDLKLVSIENPNGLNLILGQAHFIKTVEDLHETIQQGSMGIQFGLSFCEASGPCLIRSSGNRDDLIELSKQNAMNLSCGHSFIIFLDHAFPIHVLKQIQQVPEICTIFCATANPIQVAIIETIQGRGILGVIDGNKPLGFETPEDVEERHLFLRKIGYKL
jgi:adenosine/AMP kinase